MNRILPAMPNKRSIKIARTVRGAHSQLSSLFGFKLKENFFDHTSNKLKTMERKKRHYHTNGKKKNIVMRSKQGLFFSARRANSDGTLCNFQPDENIALLHLKRKKILLF